MRSAANRLRHFPTIPFDKRSTLKKGELTKGDRDERVSFNERMTAEDAAKLVTLATKLDPKVITAWLSVRDAVAKRISEMMAKETTLREALNDPNAGDGAILKSRDRVRGLLEAAGRQPR